MDQSMTNPTIKSGSTGDYVKQWQKIIGVTQDGKFGPATITATKKWQTEHNLKADGIVGPATWQASLPQTSIQSLKQAVNITATKTKEVMAALPAKTQIIQLWAKVTAAIALIGAFFITRNKIKK